jgi:hypothetical protein
MVPTLNTPAIAIQVINLNLPSELYSIGENLLLPLLIRMSGRLDNNRLAKAEAANIGCHYRYLDVKKREV